MSIATDKENWNLLVTGLVIVFLLVAATVYFYAVSDQMCTAPGRSFVIMMIALGTFMLALPFIHSKSGVRSLIFGILAPGGFIFFLTWSSVLAFDIFWTFKNFRMPSDSSKMFKFYCYFGFGVPTTLLTTVLLVGFLGDDHTKRMCEISLIWFFTINVATIVVFLLITGFFVFRISRTSNVSEEFKFKTETSRWD